MDPSQRCTRQSTSTPFAFKDCTPTGVLPVTAMPLVFDPAKRLQDLKDGLNPRSSFYYFYEAQHPNILAAIKAYEDGKMPLGTTIYFIGGKTVSEAEAAVAKSCVWEEHVGYSHTQKANKHADTSGPGSPHYHTLMLETRLPPVLGADGTRLGISVFNDTGSTVLTLLDIDLAHLGDFRGYNGWCPDTYVVVANGGVDRLLQ